MNHRARWIVRLATILLAGTLVACGVGGSGDQDPKDGRRSVATPLGSTLTYIPTVHRAQESPQIAGCAVFPADNIWNARVDDLPVDPHSDAYVGTIGANEPVHADFGAGEWPPGSGSPIGIPYVVVPGTQPGVEVAFDYDDESDPGPYPVPPDAQIEGGADADGDRHVLVVDSGRCMLYELYRAYLQDDGSWNALAVDTTAGADSNVSVPLLIDTIGSYKFQCRVCDSADNSSCTSYQASTQ